MLRAGDKVLVGGSFLEVPAALAAEFRDGDSIIGLSTTGTLLHIPKSQLDMAKRAVTSAVEAFRVVAAIAQARVTDFYEAFAGALEDEGNYALIASANAMDVESARARGRSVTRLELTPAMRADMVSGLRMWASSKSTIGMVEETVVRAGMEVDLVRSPVGPVAFIFEGRPNVFADATGVLRSGNTVVFRIGGDALGTASAIMDHAVRPALVHAGLPLGSVSLVESRDHAAGWALFSDSRLALAVARGSGEAVAQLGEIARQAGIPVSLHGTGGAWMIVSPSAPRDRIASSVRWSLDRKVCNTLNVLCVVRQGMEEVADAVAASIAEAANARGERALVHVVGNAVPLERKMSEHGVETVPAAKSDLSTEWEWENRPELSVVVVDSIEQAVSLFNQYAPHFIVSVLTCDAGEQELVWQTANAPFVGDGFTRWVDGQFALDKPELGLSNWQGGRMLARSGVLSGDSVYSVRLRARQTDANLHR